ncbi:cardiolipin synthase [Deltaproteobacteria bacterium Smac51]|nr:cardiolipin synthase [Deltaproteobacteria bacterium Smac51]
MDSLAASLDQVSLYTIVLTVMVGVSLLCVGIVVFFERKNPTSSIAWVLLLLFLPVVGFIAYLFLGTGFRVNKKKKYQLKAINDDLYDNFIRRHLNIAEALRFMEAHESTARLVTYLSSDGDGIFTGGNTADVFTDGNDMFESLIADIKNARQHIHMLYFIFNNDDIGKEVAGLLTYKVKQGVEVRLIYDSVGSRAIFSPPIFRKLRKAGGQVIGFSPVFSNLNSHLRLNYRNHRKITVIDGHIGYVGGMNIGDEYRGRDHQKKILRWKKPLVPWRDTHLRIVGPAVWFLQERFLMDWGYSSEMELHDELNIPKFFPECTGSTEDLGIQIVSGGPDTGEKSPIKSGLLTMINSARRNIYLQTPYFTPDESFLDALRIAASSDIDVRLMLPSISDHWVSQMIALGYARQLLQYGVRVFLYNGFIHSKALVSDGLVTSIGTSNLTTRSFTIDFEINAFIYDSAFASSYETIFLNDQSNSVEINEEWFESQSGFTRGCYNFTRLFSPLM